MRYVVTGGTGFIGRRVVSRILDRSPDAEVWVLVRRESLARFEKLAARGDNPWGDRAKPLVGDLTADGLGLSDETFAELGIRRPRGALRRDLRHHRVRGRPARGECRGHEGGDRARAPARRDPAPRVVDRGGGHLSRRVHRRGLRRRPGPADAVSPDQVRGRVAGALGAGPALPRLSARCGGRRFAHRRDGQGRRPVLLLRHAGEAGGAADVHPDCAARHRAHQHRARRLRRRRPDRVDARPRPRRSDVPPHRARRPSACAASTAGIAAAAGLPPLRGSLPRGAATPFLQGDGSRKGAAQHGGHPAGHPGRDPRRRRPGADLHRRQHARSVAGQRNHGSGVLVVRAEAVALLGRAPRPRPRAPRRSGRPAGR